MGRKLGLIGILLVVSLAFAAPAFAQIQNGSLFIKAADEQGAAVPGASVTITAPVLPAAITGVTDSSGSYRSPLVPVGTYVVKVSLQGFQTITRENVVLLQSQTITLEFTMKVSTVNEEVTVKGESPVVDTKSTTVNVNLDKNLLENTPGGKDIWNILEYKVPGLIFDQPDVGGNQAGLQRGFTARGTPNSQNVQLINGSNVGDPAAIGFSMNYYDPNSFENIQVSTGSQDISMGTSGVVVNLVSKSGTNVFSGLGLYTYQGDKTQWDNIDSTLYKQGFRPNANAVDYISNYNAQAGGPMIKNKLFYFGSINFQPTHVRVPGFPVVAPTNIPTQLAGTSDEDTTDILTGAAKFTYQLNASNRFDSYLQKQRYDKPNRGAGNTVTQDSAFKEYDIDNTAQILWNWVVSDKLFANTNLSYNNVHFPLNQKTGQQPITDSSTNILYRNATSQPIMFRRRIQFTTNWQYFVPQMLGGRHEFKVGYDNAYTPEDVETDRVDNVTETGTVNAANVMVPSQVTVYNTPLFVKRAVNNTAIYGQDSYSIGRLNVIAGVRWERVNGSLPDQTHPSSQYFPTGMVINGLNVKINATGQTLTSYTVPDTFAAVNNSPLWKNWAPRVSGIYDLTGEGKTVLKASWGEYYDQIGTGTPGPNPNGTISQTYNWSDNGDAIFQPGNATWNGTQYVGGEFGALRSTSIPNPNPFDPTLLRTYRVETTVGIDKELWAGVRGSATYIHRRDRNPQGTVDTGGVDSWPTAYTPVTLNDPGPDGVVGTADDASFIAYSLNSGITPTTKTVNDDRLSTFFNGLELTVTKRYAKGFALVGGYTYSHTTTDTLSIASPNALINSAGENGGRRHIFKLTGSYLFPYQITFGVNLRMQSGLPTNRVWSVPACGAAQTTGCVFLPSGSNNTTINVAERGSFLLPALNTLDLRVGKLFTMGKQRFEFDMDVYNLTNANTVYSIRTGTGLTRVVDYSDPAAQNAINNGQIPTGPTILIPTFNSATGVLGPRIIRFGVTFWFSK
ncbi:MAG TPA: carboxypeptidase regulatory-like domain-containing protein [Vicinamibacterales bacterium]|nr:carboxypeptidase regulatory-like domain-containing protein [Vicinamibacterales bacterium]